MLDNNYKNKEQELVNLVSFAYDLHEEKLDDWHYCHYLFPVMHYYYGLPYPSTQLKEGALFGFRGYSDHSTCKVFTQIGLSVGKIKDEKLDFDYAIMFSVNNEEEYVYTSLLEIDDSSKLQSNSNWYDLEEQERINLFVKSMTIIGFKEEDVREVIKGNMTARDAYINVAPENKKYIQWVNKERRYYYFDRNVAIKGTFSNIGNFDKFPFPFDGEVILDCSKVKTSGIELNENKRKVRLINVNENKDSISYANLRNATIDEVIDLSKVDATWTKFGHQKLINLDASIAKLEDMNLTLACDIDGNRFETDINGKIEYNSFEEIDNISENERIPLKVLANVDNLEMIVEALENNADGVGLIRTETCIYQRAKIERYMSLILGGRKRSSLEFKAEQKQLLDSIIKCFPDERVIIRLFDFRFNDILKFKQVTDADLDYKYNAEYNATTLAKLRGANFLYCRQDILKSQVEAILEVAKKHNKQVDILIPYIEDEWRVESIKEQIDEISTSIGINCRVGAMIENRYSVTNADQISRLVDFLSIGLNDLTEDITGKSRDSRDSSFYYLNDEVKEYVQEAIYRAKAGNPDIEIGICGEHTNYLENLDFFEKIGVNSISVSPSYISSIKTLISRNTTGKVLIKNNGN